MNRMFPTPHGDIWTEARGLGTPGIPLLVLHGDPGFISMPQTISDLADKRPVLFYDQLGYGRSDRPSDKSFFAVDRYVAELAAVRNFLHRSES